MGRYSDKAAIAICDRCNFKYHYYELLADGNTPGLRVCEDCRDHKDPWRLTPVRPDTIAVRKPRPDVFLGVADTHTILWNTPGLHWNQPGLKWNQQVADVN